MGRRGVSSGRGVASLKVLFHVKHDPPDSKDLARWAADLGVALPAGAEERLEAFEAMLGDRGIALGLVARSDAHRLRERHIVDCLRAVAVIGEGDELAYDIGSGAGLPGVVLAVARPSLRVRLVEPRRKRAAFLEWVTEGLALENAAVVAGRIEEQREQADLCFARAFAPLPEAWEVARPLLRPGGRLVHFSGVGSDAVVDPSGAGRVEVLTTPLLASAGPLTIMTR
jgi:16S rRNA (guanine527-N7)-methyltransferase